MSGSGRPRLIDRRLVSPDEGEKLARGAAAVCAELAERGIASRLVERDRWRRIVVLTAPAADEAIDKRLAQAGIGGPAELVELATRLAHGAGVSRPRVSLRGNRLVFALTDPSDSMRWLLQWIVRYRDYDAREVLVVGDDFGPDDRRGGGRAAPDDPRTARRFFCRRRRGCGRLRHVAYGTWAAAATP